VIILSYDREPKGEAMQTSLEVSFFDFLYFESTNQHSEGDEIMG
jgi:hypothetical protein